MRSLLVLAVALVISAAAAAPALAQLPLPNEQASRMSTTLAEKYTRFHSRREQRTRPNSGSTTVDRCKVVTRYRGRCRYLLPIWDGGVMTKVCRRRVVTTINKDTHRIRSRVVRLGCEAP